MKLLEAAIEELTARIFPDGSVKGDSLFRKDAIIRDGETIFYTIYFPFFPGSTWSERIFGNTKGKIIPNGNKEYNEQYDQQLLLSIVENYLSDVSIWCKEDPCSYLKRIFIQHSESQKFVCNVLPETILYPDSNIFVALQGENIGEEKIVLYRGFSSLHRVVINYKWMDSYVIETRQDGIIKSKEEQFLRERFNQLAYVDKIIRLFFDSNDFPRLKKDCMQVTDLGSDKYRFEVLASALDHFNEDYRWLEVLSGGRNEFGAFAVEGSYNELKTRIDLVRG